MKRDDIVTKIQTAKVMTGFNNTVDESMKIKMLDGIMKRIIDGQDRYQILTWLNRELYKAGLDKKHVIDYCWNLVEKDIP